MAKSYFLALTGISLGSSFCLVFLSSSWVVVWMGLELNLMSFVVLILSSLNASESPMKYFLTQSCASIIFLQLLFFLPQKFSVLLIIPLGMKAGIAPFHFWFPVVSASLSWNLNLLLMTVQKLIPLYLILTMKVSKTLLGVLSLMGVLIGGLGGMNELSLKKILAFSSISHMGWMFSAMIVSNYTMIFYMFCYMTMTLMIIISLSMSNINWLGEIANSKNIFEISVNFLSLSGFPPLLGFFPKWLVLVSLVKVSMVYSFILAGLSLISLFFYLKIIFYPLNAFFFKQINISVPLKGSMVFWNSFIFVIFAPLFLGSVVYNL